MLLIVPKQPNDDALAEVIAFLGEKPSLGAVVGKALRKAFDEVIDGPRTGRYSVSQLEKTEKTYIGTKVEIVLRDELDLERGSVLDNLICGHEVDTKFSLSGEWMIPREAVGELCLVVKSSDSGVFSMGVLRASPDVLRVGANQDSKGCVSAAGRLLVTWLCDNHPMPPNFLQNLDDETRTRILSPKAGMERTRQLFLHATGQIIPRSVVEQVAQQKDPLRRARQMKEQLASRGVKVLCSTYEADRAQFEEHGFTDYRRGDWLSIKTSP